MTSRRVWLTDVGPRDGLQNQAVILTPDQRLMLVQKLLAAGVPQVEAGAFVSPKAVPAMAGTDQLLQQLAPADRAATQVLIPNLRGYQLARDAGASTVMLVVCSSETMNQKNVGLSVNESLAAAAAIAQQAQADGIRLLACAAVAWACPFEGQTAPDQVRQLAQQLLSLGAAQVIVADTIGAAAPSQVASLMTLLVQDMGAEKLACHFHDTRALGLANVYAALEAGIRHFDASVGGLGGCPFAPGATGNVATEDVVMMLHQMGYETGIDLARLMDVGHWIGEQVQACTGGRADSWRQLQLQKGRPLW